MKLLFIISGSIAVKKCPIILKELSRKKVYIDCIVTNSAKKIIKKNIIQKYIKGKIFIDSSEKNNKMLHIILTRKSDLVVVCPATANLIAKFSHGYANDLASTSLIVTNKQVLFMPAMNVEMWNNKVNQNNVKILQKSGIEFIGPEYGYLSCGEIGLGRLSNEKKIIQIILSYLKKSKKLTNMKCLVTAGPTLEPIDPIRYISNHSSGKQGYEIAKQLMLNGAKVILISGPTDLQPPPNVKIIKVKTAKEMNKAVINNLKSDVAVFTAAVCDVSPKKIVNVKIKKENLNNIILKTNTDIIKNASTNSNNRPKFIIGFAAVDSESGKAALDWINRIVDEPEIGKIYEGKVVKLMDFGAFVNIMESKDGLVHISQLRKERVAKVSDVVNEGDIVKVKVIDIDSRGKVKLSMKEFETK